MRPGVQRNGVTEVVIVDTKDCETDLVSAVVLLEFEFVITIAGQGRRCARSVRPIHPEAGSPWNGDIRRTGSEITGRAVKMKGSARIAGGISYAATLWCPGFSADDIDGCAVRGPPAHKAGWRNDRISSVGDHRQVGGIRDACVRIAKDQRVGACLARLNICHR